MPQPPGLQSDVPFQNGSYKMKPGKCQVYQIPDEWWALWLEDSLPDAA